MRALVIIFAVFSVASALVIQPNGKFWAEKPSGRITGGQFAKPGQFPYQVGLLLERGFSSTELCGGSLIHKKWVLTAAHCVDGVDRAFIFLGATNLVEPNQKIQVGRKQFHVHPNWDSRNVTNDIALIELTKNVVLNERVQLVKLPTIGRKYSSYRGVDVVASGWGATSDHSMDPSLDLRFVVRKVLPNSICSHLLGSIVQPSNICIDTTGGRSTCFGDSGGPLVINDIERTQIGITSFGGKECENEHPAVFTRITSYLDWIAYTTKIPF